MKKHAVTIGVLLGIASIGWLILGAPMPTLFGPPAKYEISWSTQPRRSLTPEQAYDNIQMQIANTAYSKGRPRIMGNVASFIDWNTGLEQHVTGNSFTVRKVPEGE